MAINPVSILKVQNNFTVARQNTTNIDAKSSENIQTQPQEDNFNGKGLDKKKIITYASVGTVLATLVGIVIDFKFAEGKHVKKLWNKLTGKTKEIKPEDKPGVKPEDKPGAKPEVIPGVKPEDKPGAKPEVIPGVKPEDKPGAKPEVIPGVKPEDKPGAKPEVIPGVKLENYEKATSKELIKEWERLGAVRENIDDVSQSKLHYQLGVDMSRIEDILMGTGHIRIENKWIHVNDIKYSESYESGKMAELLEEYKGESAEFLTKQFYHMLKEYPDLESLSSAYFQAPIMLLKQKGWSFKNGNWVKLENGRTIVIPQKIRGTNDLRFIDAKEFDSEKFKLLQTDDNHGMLLLKENELPQENILSGIGHEKTNQAYRKGNIRVLSPAFVEFKDGVWTVTKELEYIING